MVIPRRPRTRVGGVALVVSLIRPVMKLMMVTLWRNGWLIRFKVVVRRGRTVPFIRVRFSLTLYCVSLYSLRCRFWLRRVMILTLIGFMKMECRRRRWARVGFVNRSLKSFVVRVTLLIIKFPTKLFINRFLMTWRLSFLFGLKFLFLTFPGMIGRVTFKRTFIGRCPNLILVGLTRLRLILAVGLTFIRGVIRGPISRRSVKVKFFNIRGPVFGGIRFGAGGRGWQITVWRLKTLPTVRNRVGPITGRRAKILTNLRKLIYLRGRPKRGVIGGDCNLIGLNFKLFFLILLVVVLLERARTMVNLSLPALKLLFKTPGPMTFGDSPWSRGGIVFLLSVVPTVLFQTVVVTLLFILWSSRWSFGGRRVFWRLWPTLRLTFLVPILVLPR